MQAPCGSAAAGEPPRLYMANTNVQTGATPAPKSLAARFIGMITSPHATYESVVAHPKWFGDARAHDGADHGARGRVPMTSKVGQDALVRYAGRHINRPGMVPSNRSRAWKEIVPFGIQDAPRLDASSCVTLIVVIYRGESCSQIFNAALGGNADVQAGVHRAVHAARSGVLAQLFTVPLNYANGHDDELDQPLRDGPVDGDEDLVYRQVSRDDRPLPGLAAPRALHGAGGALSPPHAANRDNAAGVVSRYRGDRRLLSGPGARKHEPGTRKLSSLLGSCSCLARSRSPTSCSSPPKAWKSPPTGEETATSRRSCPPPARSSRSATSTSAPTRWAGSPTWR